MPQTILNFNIESSNEKDSHSRRLYKIVLAISRISFYPESVYAATTKKSNQTK